MNATLEQRQLDMYGVRDIENWRATILKQNGIFQHSIPFLAISMLSDVQELVERGRAEDARQDLNRVKYLLRTQLIAPREMEAGDL
jgi:hypothetical protein